MTAEDVRSELDRQPFVPFRLHLVSGRTIDVLTERTGWMLRHAILILHDPSRRAGDSGYNVIALRNIEMIEQLLVGGASGKRGIRP